MPATPPAILNLEVLDALREAWSPPTDLWIRVQNPLGHREAHFAAGSLVGGASTLRDDLLGVLLAAEGRFDLDLLEPMAREAKAQGLRAGELMVREKLLTQAELDQALVRQASTRLLRMLAMPGLVTTGPGVSESVAPRPLAPLVAELFVERLDASLLGPLAARLAGRTIALTARAPEFGLKEELARHLPGALVAQGQLEVDLVALPEPSLRLCCAMLALGVVEAR